LVDWTLPPEDTPFDMRGEVKAGVATIVVEGDVQEDARLSARVVGPQLNVMEVPLAATALGRFEAGFPANDQGPYLLQIVEEGAQGKRRSSAAGLVAPYSPEYKDLEARPRLLERLAAITNGRVLDNPSESFGPGLPPGYGDVPLGWWLLMAAALLLPLDVALRRLNLPLTDVVVWLAAAKAWALRGRVTSIPEAASPVLESMRKRRAAGPDWRLATQAGGNQVRPSLQYPGGRTRILRKSPRGRETLHPPLSGGRGKGSSLRLSADYRPSAVQETGKAWRATLRRFGESTRS
jgi:hypothetical protein